MDEQGSLWRGLAEVFNNGVQFPSDKARGYDFVVIFAVTFRDVYL